MATLDTRPQVVDLMAYAGDTLTLTVTAPGSVTDGKTWTAQIKATRNSDVIDAEFTITPPITSGGPAVLVLSSATTALLTGSSTVMTRTMTTAGTFAVGTQYKGVWDCQVSDPMNPDPVRTVVQGTITLDPDVTRL